MYAGSKERQLAQQKLLVTSIDHELDDISMDSDEQSLNQDARVNKDTNKKRHSDSSAAEDFEL